MTLREVGGYSQTTGKLKDVIKKKRRHGHNITQPVTDLGSQPVSKPWLAIFSKPIKIAKSRKRESYSMCLCWEDAQKDPVNPPVPFMV